MRVVTADKNDGYKYSHSKPYRRSRASFNPDPGVKLYQCLPAPENMVSY